MFNQNPLGNSLYWKLKSARAKAHLSLQQTAAVFPGCSSAGNIKTAVVSKCK